MNAVNSCLAAKYLTLNPKKYCYMFISRKRTHPILQPCLTMGNSLLACVTSYKYLGVLISSVLMWSAHISKILCNKSRKLIRLLYRRFCKYSSADTLLKLYVAFIRPHLEYAAAVWDPFLKDIDIVEDVQKF